MEDSCETQQIGPIAGIQTFVEFTQNTTFHGVRYIFHGTLKLRKFLWLLCVVGAIAVFMFQVGQRTYDYFQYNTNVDVQIVYSPEIPFPAVTFCNQNNFRMSVAVDHNLYYFIDEMYSVRNVSLVDLSKYSINHLDTETFLKTAAHQVDDFIDSCTWKGEPCNKTQHIVTTLTDMGVCYTFNSGKSINPLMVSDSGSGSGLSLILNLEQYEYMRGPRNDAGIKILLHDQGEFPLMNDLGFAVAPGTHTLVGVQRTLVKSMEPPYGDCNASNPTPMSNCMIDCRTEVTVKNCGCRDIYMQNLTTTPADVCEMDKQFVCIRKQSATIMQEQGRSRCKVQCVQTQYEPSLSYAQLSKFNIDRMVLNDPERRALVNDKFLQARELSQHVNLDISDSDRSKFLDIKEKLNVFWEDIKVVGPALSQDNTFAELFNILPVIEEGDEYFRQDIVAISTRLITASQMFEPVMTTRLTYIDKFLQTAISNLHEMSISGSGLNDTAGYCLTSGNISFPLPQYSGDIKGYLGDHSRKKRSHSESTVIANFYAIDAPEYLKLSTLDNCNDYLSLKQDMAAILVSHYDAVRSDAAHIQTIYTSFMQFIKYMYRNTSSSPYEFPKYQMCLDVLEEINSTMWTDIDLLIASMQAFATVDTVSDVRPAILGMLGVASHSTLLDIATQTIEGKLKLNCHWPFLEYLSEDLKGADIRKYNDYVIDLNNAYISYPTFVVSFTNIGNYAQEMYSIMQKAIMPSLSIFDDYLEGRVTKLDLAQVFNSLSLQKAFQDIDALGADFISVAREFDQRFKSALHYVKTGYSRIFSTSFPFVDNELLWNSEFISHAAASNVTQMLSILDQFHYGTNVSAVFMALLDQIITDYTDNVDVLKNRLPIEIDELLKSVNRRIEELQTYTLESKLNQWFFLENFVQVDVFYKGMSYSEIHIRETFPFLSLLSEVGGFMGLLLGASCLTIIEIFDFTIMSIIKQLKKKMTVQPLHDRTIIM